MTPHGLIRAALVVVLAACAAPARAELIFFDTGRALSVKSYVIEGNSLVLTLRTGGTITCERSVVARIEPDEVPYPEPEAERLALAPPTPPPAIPATLPKVPYGAFIDRFASEQNVPVKLVRAVIKTESNFQERARSRKGAMGLMQLMPETARQYAVADPYEPSSNIEGGIKYLRSLLDRFELPLALAAYNAGEAAVRRFGGIPPYPETRAYVQRVLAVMNR
jgi:soluble lytic murein transglycosylase-like protein